MPRLYFTTIVSAEDEETLIEWARAETAIQRRDRDVVDIDVRLVTDTPEGRPVCSILNLQEVTP
jgi:hypothetical protein